MKLNYLQHKNKKPAIAYPTLAFLFVCLTILLITGCDSKAPVYKDSFSNDSRFKKHWTIINGTWTVADNSLTGDFNSDWTVILGKKALPEDFILTFDARMEPKSVILEVILGFKEEKYLGVYIYQIENVAAIADRSLFLNEKYVKQGTYIRSTGNIGKLAKQPYQFNYEWMYWKIQKTGSQLYIWINGEPVIAYNDTQGLLNSGGRLGFAVKGAAQIQDVRLFNTKNQELPAPQGFAGKTERKSEQPLFLFSE